MTKSSSFRLRNLVTAASHLLRRPALVGRSLVFLLRTGSPKAVMERVREYLWVKRNAQGGRESVISTTFFDWSQVDLPGLRRRLDDLPRRPMLSIVTPLYNTPDNFLRACIGSVRDQVYPDWEMILVDDASPDPHARQLAARYAEADPRIKLVARPENGNISKASNDGIAAAQGEFILFLDHDDEISPSALLRFAEEIVAHPEADAIYSDQWKCDEHGRVIAHHYKPDWSPVFLMGVMYVGHLLGVRADLVRALGGFDSTFDGVQDFEFMLRLSERTHAVRHIPEALYKWRAIAGSLAAGENEKSGIEEKQAQAVNGHIERLGLPFVAQSNPKLGHRIMLKPSAATPTGKVSIVIPSKDQGEVIGRCLDSIFGLTDYPDFEVIVVDNGTTDPVALAAFARHPIKHTPFNEKFNYSRANNLGVAQADGEFILLLNNDTEVLDADWLRTLVAYLADPKVGAVGPVLLYPDGRVQHAGVVIGSRGTADHAMRFFPAEVDGYAGSLCCSREVSAVTAACLLMRRSLFHEVGGFSEDYATHYQDVDLCLKIRENNYAIICAAYPKLVHYESLSRKEGGYDRIDRAILIDRWYDQLKTPDPFYNINLNIERLDYSAR
jgi:GT2 family glycosyltransferase